MTAPVVYLYAATAVCAVVVGVIVAAACVLNCSVFVPVTVTVPAVPDEIYPAVTVGVMLFVDDAVAVIRPPVETVIVGLAVTVVAGVFADPLETDLEDADS